MLGDFAAKFTQEKISFKKIGNKFFMEDKDLEKAKLRQKAESLWTPERLKEYIKTRLEGKSIFMLSNRESYMHVHRGQEIEIIKPDKLRGWFIKLGNRTVRDISITPVIGFKYKSWEKFPGIIIFG